MFWYYMRGAGRDPSILTSLFLLSLFLLSLFLLSLFLVSLLLLSPFSLSLSLHLDLSLLLVSHRVIEIVLQLNSHIMWNASSHALLSVSYAGSLNLKEALHNSLSIVAAPFAIRAGPSTKARLSIEARLSTRMSTHIHPQRQ